MLASQLLIGKKSVKGQQVKAIIQQHIPEFASMDLLASYKDFLSGIPLYLTILENLIVNEKYLPRDILVNLIHKVKLSGLSWY